ncbi:D-3-phosphoglycerate dehydrogenase (serA) [Pyrobaculum aerophilum str. IM2]|uniref:D-3-phosphoglycerate dehydrogenase (SerA) n=2 Tax=Pyrobaculum aerophilum TaxID=13773 RepID=Q8ZXX8_PYRAE|nr:D-glycerate dehydrogenase [Pyrobaculum aerophilum]AAL63218.1 D-3-phosphoglycerate dehydrogenase (serA) [Pyrobaculum aerophilum str. IM2]HII48024.1 D-glycerate dehydrogenase [Pyrobaculum aerophilum]
MPCIFVSREGFPESMYKKLEEVGRVEVYRHGGSPWSTRGVPKEVLIDAARRCEALVIFIGDVIDKEVLDAGEKLKIVSTASVGVDHIDVEYAKRKGVVVAHTPYVLVDAVADLAVGLLIAVTRKIALGDRLIRSGAADAVWGSLMGVNLRGKRAGIVGLGNIGVAIARRLKAFDIEVAYWSRRRKPEVEFALGIEYMELDSLLSSSDFIFLTMALTPETRWFFNRERFAKVKRGAYFINVARGGLVDTDALIEALEAGVLAGAALDVFDVEPLPARHKLASMDNVVLTPHIGSATVETRRRMAELAAENVVSFFRTGRPIYAV